jgi:hypothetical protein
MNIKYDHAQNQFKKINSIVKLLNYGNDKMINECMNPYPVSCDVNARLQFLCGPQLDEEHPRIPKANCLPFLHKTWEFGKKTHRSIALTKGYTQRKTTPQIAPSERDSAQNARASGRLFSETRGECTGAASRLFI